MGLTLANKTRSKSDHNLVVQYTPTCTKAHLPRPSPPPYTCPRKDTDNRLSSRQGTILTAVQLRAAEPPCAVPHPAVGAPREDEDIRAKQSRCNECLNCWISRATWTKKKLTLVNEQIISQQLKRLRRHMTTRKPGVFYVLRVIMDITKVEEPNQSLTSRATGSHGPGIPAARLDAAASPFPLVSSDEKRLSAW